MPYGSKYAPVVIDHRSSRAPSVSSWATRTTAAYQSQSSYRSDSSSSSYPREEIWRDPKSSSDRVEIKERKNRDGTIVSVTNHHRRNSGTHEPKPEYKHASRYHNKEKW